MTAQRNLELLKRGIDYWNQWRMEHPLILPDLTDTDLSEVDLSGADLSEALQLHL
jgi:uncharacterized protein YjbI with pentapeptide repeats